MPAETSQWLHVKMTENERELMEKLDRMVAEEFSDRSKFVRKLISQEWSRRFEQLAFPLADVYSRKEKAAALSRPNIT